MFKWKWRRFTSDCKILQYNQERLQTLEYFHQILFYIRVCGWLCEIKHTERCRDGGGGGESWSGLGVFWWSRLFQTVSCWSLNIGSRSEISVYYSAKPPETSKGFLFQAWRGCLPFAFRPRGDIKALNWTTTCLWSHIWVIFTCN